MGQYTYPFHPASKYYYSRTGFNFLWGFLLTTGITTATHGTCITHHPGAQKLICIFRGFVKKCSCTLSLRSVFSVICLITNIINILSSNFFIRDHYHLTLPNWQTVNPSMNWCRTTKNVCGRFGIYTCNGLLRRASEAYMNVPISELSLCQIETSKQLTNIRHHNAELLATSHWVSVTTFAMFKAGNNSEPLSSGWVGWTICKQGPYLLWSEHYWPVNNDIRADDIP